MPTTTVRVTRKTRDALRDLAKMRGVSMADIAAEAVERLMREDLMDRANEAYAALRADPKAWQEELDERALWEVTLADGLDDE